MAWFLRVGALLSSGDFRTSSHAYRQSQVLLAVNGNRTMSANEETPPRE